MIHFDFDDRYQDEQVVGTALSRHGAVLMSVIVHGLVVLALLLVPTLPYFERLARELDERRQAAQQQAQVRPPRENRTFVFVQPRVDLEAPQPPPRPELSDKDRIAQSRERSENPTNSLPFARGNSSNRVEASAAARPRGPESPRPPSPGEVAQTQPAPDTRRLPPADAGLPVPPENTQQARVGSGALGEALQNLQKYVQRESFNNPRGGDTQKFGPFIQFDTKGVEFGPWIRRFVAQVKRNWDIPYAALALRGHVVLQFNVHKDGRITDVALVGPSNVDGFNHAAMNAILASNPTAPLPPEYPADRAFFTVTFYYNEEPTGQ